MKREGEERLTSKLEMQCLSSLQNQQFNGVTLWLCSSAATLMTAKAETSAKDKSPLIDQLLARLMAGECAAFLNRMKESCSFLVMSLGYLYPMASVARMVDS